VKVAKDLVYVGAVTEALGRCLVKYGFERFGDTDWSSDKGHRTWSRWRNWKREVFELNFAKMDAVKVELAVRLYLSRLDDHLMLDSSSVDLAGREHYFDFSFPTAWSGINVAKCADYVGEVLDLAVNATRWFDIYSSPNVALDRLQSGITVWGESTGPLYVAMREHLCSLIER
jgi:hypothetical protein